MLALVATLGHCFHRDRKVYIRNEGERDRSGDEGPYESECWSIWGLFIQEVGERGNTKCYLLKIALKYFALT